MDDIIVQKIRTGQLEEDLAKAKAEKESIQVFYQAKIDVRIEQFKAERYRIADQRILAQNESQS